MKGLKKALIIFFVFYLCIISGILYMTFNSQKNELIDTTRRSLEKEAESLSYDVARDFPMISNANMLNEHQEVTSELERHQENFKRRSEIFDYEYLFAFAYIDGDYVYLVDSTSSLQKASDSQAFLLEEEKKIREKILSTYDQPKTVSVYLDSDDWGEVFKSYSSIYYEDQVIGYIGVSVEAGEMIASLQKEVLMMLLIYLGIHIIVVLVVLTIVELWGLRPMKSLTEDLDKISNYYFGELKHSEKYIERKDEIGDLTRSIQAVDKNVMELIKNMSENANVISERTQQLLQGERGVEEDSLEELAALSQQNASILLDIENFQKRKEKTELGSFKIDTKGRVLQLNDKMCEFFNKHRKEIVGKTITQLVPGSCEKALMSKIEEIKRKGNGSYEIKYYRKDAKDLCLELTMNSDDKGSIYGLAKDVTEVRKWQKKVRDSERRYTAFINASKDMIFIKNPDKEFILVNERLLLNYNRSRAEILGKTDDEIGVIPNLKQTVETDNDVLNNKNTVFYETYMNNRVFSVMKFPVETVTGEMGIGGIARDITDEKRVENEIDFILKSISDSILIVNRDGYIHSVYSNSMPISNFKEIEKGTHLKDYLSDDVYEGYVASINHALDNNKVSEFQYGDENKRVTVRSERLDFDKALLIIKDSEEGLSCRN